MRFFISGRTTEKVGEHKTVVATYKIAVRMDDFCRFQADRGCFLSFAAKHYHCVNAFVTQDGYSCTPGTDARRIKVGG